jgi:hypothetical protein
MQERTLFELEDCVVTSIYEDSGLKEELTKGLDYDFEDVEGAVVSFFMMSCDENLDVSLKISGKAYYYTSGIRGAAKREFKLLARLSGEYVSLEVTMRYKYSNTHTRMWSSENHEKKDNDEIVHAIGRKAMNMLSAWIFFRSWYWR